MVFNPDGHVWRWDAGAKRQAEGTQSDFSKHRNERIDISCPLPCRLCRESPSLCSTAMKSRWNGPRSIARHGDENALRRFRKAAPQRNYRSPVSGLRERTPAMQGTILWSAVSRRSLPVSSTPRQTPLRATLLPSSIITGSLR